MGPPSSPLEQSGDVRFATSILGQGVLLHVPPTALPVPGVSKPGVTGVLALAVEVAAHPQGTRRGLTRVTGSL